MSHKTIKLGFSSIAILLLTLTLSACGSKPAQYNSKSNLGSQVNYTITGIDAGAGIMASTQKALTEYPNLANNNWQLQPSSTAAMTSTLDKAIKYKQPIVVTGWQPHWMFKKFPIKFLKDPKNAYGKSESIDTIARNGLRKDNPGAYKLLKNFKWNASMMSDVMLAVNNGEKPEIAAKSFIKKHPDQTKKWLDGVPNGNGKAIKLTYVAWDSEIASTNVVSELLKIKGYKPTIQAMEMQPMWASVATGASDASTAAWLPTTAGLYYKQYKDKIEVVQTSLKGARTGLAVPKYMKNINSIEDLKK